MNTTTKLIGTGISVALLLAVLSLGGPATAYVDVPSVLFVFGLVGGGLWACFGPHVIWQALRASVGVRPLEEGPLDLYVAVFRRGYQLAWASGVVGLLVGVVQMLRALEDPSQLGAGMSVALLTLLYGSLAAELGFRNFQQWLMNRRRAVLAD